MRDTVIFRVDGSSQIGIGHVTRCVSLAMELSERGFEAVFCIKPEDESLLRYIRKKGFRVSKIPVAALLHEDAECLLNKVEKYNAKVVIVDGYGFKSDYLRKIKRGYHFLLSIDDIAKIFYCSDIVINQNIHATKSMYSGKISDTTKMLLGPDYALLKPEFKKSRAHKRIFDKVSNILVTLGGADPDNQTLKVIRALGKVKGDFKIVVVLGISNPNRKSILDYAASSNKKFDIINNAEDMSRLMLDADMAVSAGGTTTWELCCLGVPTLQIILAENQEGAVKELGRSNVTINLGWYEDVAEDDITAAASVLMNNVRRRRMFSNKSRSLVDGRGAQRVASQICAFLKRKG